MNKLKALFLSVAVAFSISMTAQPKADLKMDQFVRTLMGKMTLDEKIGQLHLPVAADVVTGQANSSETAKFIRQGRVGGILNIKTAAKIHTIQKVAVEESRLKIPLMFGLDVIHGYQTMFPIPLALSCSWDLKLIEQSARIAAQEASADGQCWTFSPMVDISRDPRWGRVSEGSGEDPYLGSLIAKAMINGYQGDDLKKNNTIMACVKHFALYGAVEAGREYNTTDMSRLRMYNEYFAPYKAAVEAGAGSVMTSFNEVDGIPASGNKWLMTDVLRKQWGFGGFIVTDYTAIPEMSEHGLGDLQQVSKIALQAGVDMDMVGEGFLTTLKKSLKEGLVTQSQIDMACRRVLEAKYKLGLFDDPFRYCDEERAKNELFTTENRMAARNTATQAIVLLKNSNQILPLKRRGTIALVGPLADNKENMTGTWSVAADYPKSVSLLTGMREAVGTSATILMAKGTNVVNDTALNSRISIFGKPTYYDNRTQSEMVAEAVAIAKKSDVVIAALGEAAEMSGECASRSDINLPENQKELLKALLATGKPVVVVLFNGRPLSLSWENANATAIVESWFLGSEAGNAIADVLFGKVNPSGKLTMTFPQNIGQIPLYYNHKNTGRPLVKGWFEKFHSNFLDVSNEPLYPFGYGLGYSLFSYGDLKLSATTAKGNQIISASIAVTNAGQFDGDETVQLYLHDLAASVTRPVKELKGFQKIALKAGETKEVSFKLSVDDLKFYNSDLKYDWESGDFEIMVGGNSRDLKSVKINWVK
ncbi:MAG: beta-glucosidase BglX [Bacteroidia bacterium]|nr:beta-glucosidase BglX [Bacteroidia bacterium]